MKDGDVVKCWVEGIGESSFSFLRGKGSGLLTFLRVIGTLVNTVREEKEGENTGKPYKAKL